MVVVFEKGRDDSCQTLSCPSSLEFKNIPFSFPSSSLSGIGFPGLERFYTAREKLSNPDILGTVPAEKDPDLPESAFPVRCNQELKAIKGWSCRTGVLSRIHRMTSFCLENRS